MTRDIAETAMPIGFGSPADSPAHAARPRDPGARPARRTVVGEKDLFGVCPYITAQSLLQGKWSILILHHLAEGPVRFNDLQRRIPRMTHATLSRQLKQMEADRLIERHDLGTIPPCVEYSLSPAGRDFLPVLDALRGWGERYIDRVVEPSAHMRAQVESYR